MLFNQDTSVYAEKDEIFNHVWLQQQERYLEVLLENRGYVYLNQIYEMLGLAWNPEDENRCYIYAKGDRINFGIVDTRNGIELTNID